MTAVSTLIVNYKKATRLSSALSNLRFCAGFAGEVIVVDNSVDNKEAEILRAACVQHEAKLIVSAKNVGYAKGVNTAAKSANPANHILLMSPDILITEHGLIERMASYLDKNVDAGVLAPMQVNDDGSLVEVFRRFPTPLSQLLRRLPGKSGAQSVTLPPDGTWSVDWAQSSFCLIRHSLWAGIGGLDETYEIFMADIQLALDARSAGFNVVGMSATGVIADGIRASAGSILTALNKRSFRIHCRDALRYYAKNGWFVASR